MIGINRQMKTLELFLFLFLPILINTYKLISTFGIISLMAKAHRLGYLIFFIASIGNVKEGKGSYEL